MSFLSYLAEASKLVFPGGIRRRWINLLVLIAISDHLIAVCNLIALLKYCRWLLPICWNSPTALQQCVQALMQDSSSNIFLQPNPTQPSLPCLKNQPWHSLLSGYQHQRVWKMSQQRWPSWSFHTFSGLLYSTLRQQLLSDDPLPSLLSQSSQHMHCAAMISSRSSSFMRIFFTAWYSMQFFLRFQDVEML